MKNMKIFLSVTLAALVAVCSLPMGSDGLISGSLLMLADASEVNETAEGLLYVSNDGIASIVGYNGIDTSVIIPESISGNVVVKIGEKAFKDTNAEQIFLPKTLQEVDWYYAGEEDTISYGHGPFAGSSVKKVSFADGTTVIPEYIFSGCKPLTDITFPKSIKVIGNNAFMYCTKLIGVSLEAGLDTVEESAFAYCVNLLSVVFPETVKTLAEKAFYNCVSLKSIDLKNVAEIGSACFVSTDLSEVVIPKTLTETDFYYQGETDTDSYEHGPFAGYNLKKVTFEKGIKTIPDYVLGGCRGIKQINLPEGVIAIGKGSFEYCTSLVEIALPDKLENIEEEAFKKCSELLKISLPASTKTIGKEAFYNCTSLETAELNKVTSIGSRCFVGTALSEIIIPKTLSNADFYYEAETDTASYEHGPFAGYNLKKATFEKGTKVVPDYVLGGCRGIEEINIPDGVNEIGVGAFEYCTAINEIILPQSLEIINKEAFIGCPEVKILRLYDSIKTVEEGSFDGLYILTSEDNEAVKEMIDNEISYRAIIAGVKDKDYRLLDREAAEYTLSENDDGTYSLEIGYSFKENVKDSVSFTEIKVKMPEKTEFRYITVTVNGQKCDDYSLNNGVFKLDVENTEGKIVIKGLVGIGEEFSSYAQIDGRNNGKVFSESIGIINPLNYSEEYEIALTGSNKNVKKLLEETVVVTLGCTAGELLGTSNATLITDKDGNTVGENEKIATGMIISRKIGKIEVDFRNIAVPGDVDGDMKIAASDARLALRTSVGLENYDADAAEFRAADVDFNGKVNASDARTILRASVGLETIR